MNESDLKEYFSAEICLIRMEDMDVSFFDISPLLGRSGDDAC